MEIPTRDVVMVLYAVVWGALMLLWSSKHGGEWPPAEMWVSLGVGEGALMVVFATRATRDYRSRDRNSED